MDSTVKEYKIRKLNILDIRTIAKILKEVNITRQEVREVFENFLSESRLFVLNEHKNYNNYSKVVIPLINILIDILADSNTFWDFIADITGEDLTEIGLLDAKKLITTLLEDKELTSFFTGMATSTENLMK